MVNDGIQSNPVFVIVFIFQYQNNPGFLPGLKSIVKRLADAFRPFGSKIKFNSVGVREAITPGSVRKDNFHLAVMVVAPSGLIILFGMDSLCIGRNHKEKNDC